MKITYVVVKVEHDDHLPTDDAVYCAHTATIGFGDDNHYKDVNRVIAVVPSEEQQHQLEAFMDHCDPLCCETVNNNGRS